MTTSQWDRFDELLTTRVFGRHMVFVSRTGSTNDIVKDLANQGAPEGTVAVTDEQVSGRGRLGRHWVAPFGTCLLCSILFRPSLAPDQTNQLTMLCSLAAADAVLHVTGLQVALKWPNDLIVESLTSPRVHRKLAGILTETSIVGDLTAFSVVGIGINVNVTPETLPELAPEATSILAETGEKTDRVRLLAALLDGVEARYAALQAGSSPHQEWAERLATLGKEITASTGNTILQGVAVGVDWDGALRLRTADGEEHRLTAGDVTLA